jgi:signal transduction histidine kinase
MTTESAGPSAPDPGHVWIQAAIGWEIAFWSFLGSAALVLGLDDVGPARQLLGYGTLAVVGVTFAWVRPSSSAEYRRQDLVYLLTIVVGCGLSIAIDSSLWLLLFIAYSQMWLFGRDARQSFLLVLALTASGSLGFLSAGHWQAGAIWAIWPTMSAGLIFTVLSGVWVSRIIDQSRERAELISQLEDTRAELGAAHHAQGVMAERERMAREIHDTLAQGYTSIIMLAQAARAGLAADTADGRPAARLEMIEEVARENLDEARALVAAFAPVALDGTTLAEAVRRLSTRFGAETGVAIDVCVSGDLSGLSRDREVVLLRAVQEALANVRRHAEARRVTVNLAARDGDAGVEIVDDGIGFDLADPDRPTGYGLTGMRERARDAGGRLELVSAPGDGTRVSLRIPLTDDARVAS